MAYFSNSTEGDVLDCQCADCPIGTKPCPIILVQLVYNYDQVGNEDLTAAMNLLVDEDGTCKMRPLLVKPTRKDDMPGWLLRKDDVPNWLLESN